MLDLVTFSRKSKTKSYLLTLSHTHKTPPKLPAAKHTYTLMSHTHIGIEKEDKGKKKKESRDNLRSKRDRLKRRKQAAKRHRARQRVRVNEQVKKLCVKIYIADSFVHGANTELRSAVRRRGHYEWARLHRAICRRRS